MADGNPFKMPTDEEVFVLRDEERRQKALERESLKYKRIHEKTTWTARIGSANAALTKEDEAAVEPPKHSHTLDVNLPAVDIREKDNMAVYIAKKREMGLIRMSLATKRQEIKKLDEEAERAEKRIRQQEEQLKETDAKFEAFLKHSDIEQVDAMKRAETETKAKQEKIQEIKKLSAQIAQIETDKKKNEEQMQTCLQFKEFLDNLISQPNWLRDTLVQIRVEDAKKEIAAALEVEAAEASAADGGTEVEEGERRAAMGRKMEERCQQATERITAQVEQLTPEEIKQALDAIDPDRVPMYFVEPDQILNIFFEIEEGNLFLIQRCQELEEQIEGVAQEFQREQQEMIQIAQSRRAQMQQLYDKITVEQSKLRSLEERIARSTETGTGPTQEELKERIEEKVKMIFRTLGLGDDSNVGTLGMLTHIEMRLEEMRVYIKNSNSGIDDAFVNVVMRQRDKERRQQARQALLNKQREDRERRSRNALTRSQAPVKKRVGKPVMWRSRPLDQKKQEATTAEETAKNEDDEFFQ